MSSSTYSACLEPDPWLRIIVVICAQIIAAAGIVVLLMLPLDAAIRGAACLCWGIQSTAEQRRFRLAYARYSTIRLFADGKVMTLNNDQEWVPAMLISGGVLLDRYGWLCLRGADGIKYAELIRGDRRQSDEWRRLHVIWRHIGAAG